MKIGMLTDFVAVEYCNGPALACQSFRRHMQKRGHHVGLIGPKPNNESRAEGETILLDSWRFRQYGNAPFAMPWPLNTYAAKPEYDIIHANANSLLMHWAPMVRKLHGIPCIQTNTVHLPSFAHHVLPEDVLNGRLSKPFFDGLQNYVEKHFCDLYDAGDGLIVQCQGLVDYWRNKGLEVPLHIIPRPVDVLNFDQPLRDDPYRLDFQKGSRMVVACRHAGEKSLDQLLEIFAQEVLPKRSNASLTLIGDGPEHKALKKLAKRLGIAHRCEFVGELAQKELPNWYHHADVFTYTSMSETFGQVISETLWMGTPVVGFDDGMGVSYQVKDGENGRLVQSGDYEGFGAAVVDLFDHPTKLQVLSETAQRKQRALVHPEIVFQAYENAYLSAIDHIKRRPPTTTQDRSLKMKWGLFKEHIFPWFWKHSLLIGSGMISSGYQPKANVAFDEMPDLGPDFSGQSTKRPYLRVVENHQAMDNVVRMAEADMHKTAEKLGLSG
jgi:glycosyltransferase involved in cell wall biosynthesis